MAASRDETFDRLEDEEELMWESLRRLPSQKQASTTIFKTYTVVDVRKLDRESRELVVKKALATNDQDNYMLLSAIKDRLDRVGLEIPSVEVRYENLDVVADVQIGSRAFPTLINYTLNGLESILTGLRIYRPKRHPLTILKNIKGVIKPGRMTLLLGPPNSGKSTLLLALAGKLDSNLKKSGSITYNGHSFDEFCIQRTAAYISQTDDHISRLTVRETLDFAARCQGASECFAAYMKDLVRLEKEKDIKPDPAIDAFMKASSVGGKKHVLTDYVLKVLGLDDCSETIVGDDMKKGISGGQKKRLTTGEMIVGPRKTLFMDEISTGLDSSTTYQIVKCVGNFVHQMNGTVLMALLQPTPETFELFDDLVLLSEGHIVYQGPREQVLEFFETLGFKLPPRKAVADFLQQVTSEKDQAHYWADESKPYEYISVSEIAEAFKNSRFGRSVVDTLCVPFDKSSSHPLALSKTNYAVSTWELCKACFSREMLLIRRHMDIYIYKTIQVAVVGFVTYSLFPNLHPTDLTNGNLYLSALFFGLVNLMFTGFSELPFMIDRLSVFFKQRDNFFHPASAWSVVSWLLHVPYSVVESVVFSCIVYFLIGFAPARFFRFMFLLFLVHQMALGLFRTMASLSRDKFIANTFGGTALLIIFLSGGFIIPKESIKPWMQWAYWISPLSYGTSAVTVNEFSDQRWNMKSPLSNLTMGSEILQMDNLPTDGYWYWIGVCALLLFALLFNSIVTVALKYLNPIRNNRTVTPIDETEDNHARDGQSQGSKRSTGDNSQRKGMILPFQPLTMTFHNVSYYVDMPKKMKSKGIPEKRLQLLSKVSGVFSPGVLTGLVGSRGAGKTTMMDVLAGRKTGGYIEGEIKISGYPKEQRTFARVSGYVEQNDIHSPQVTVEESLWFSSTLRLQKNVSKEIRLEFVEEVMKLVELDPLRHALVGLPGISGLSTGQRKRLTIAVELVANPSIIFMDEPTSGLDARAAAIVMRTIRNTVNTGRTVICTIHQPSIDIFEAFDSILLMKPGGQIIYGGKLGLHSQTMINYFQGINGIPPIPNGYNPATWMLEVTTPAYEERIGEDFASLYEKSEQCRVVEESIKQFSIPSAGLNPLKFPTTFSQNALAQFRNCLWKQNLVYWRSPEYNSMRLIFTVIVALVFGSAFWGVGAERDTPFLTIVMGLLFTACLFLGINNASSVHATVWVERSVYYREKAAGMYTPLAYAAAQGLIEIPYIAVQTIVYGVITYFMVNFERTITKFLLYNLFMFLTFTYFTFFGMAVVACTRSLETAALVCSAFYSLWNIFSGFLIPKPNIPFYWQWFYDITPTAWTLRGVMTSQLGDVETKNVIQYLVVRQDYGPGMVGVSVAVLLGFCILFFAIFTFSIRSLNFHKR